MRGSNLSITANGPLTQDSWTFGLGRYGHCSILVISPVVLPDGFVRLRCLGHFAGKLLQTSHQLFDSPDMYF